MRRFNRILALVVSVFLYCVVAQAEQPIFDAASLAAETNLESFRGTIVQPHAAIAVGVPQVDGKEAALNLDGKGSGPTYHWYIYSLRNSGTDQWDGVLSVPNGQFPGSGVLRFKMPGSTVQQFVSSTGDVALQSRPNLHADAVSFTLPAGGLFSIAIQGTADTPPAVLWDRSAFDYRISQLSFARGAMLGIALLTALACLALLSLRPHRVTLAGGFFAVTSVLFIAFESGILTQVFEQFWGNDFSLPTLRAVIETLMLIAAAFVLNAFSGVDRVQPSYGIAILAVTGIGIANLVLAFR